VSCVYKGDPLLRHRINRNGNTMSKCIVVHLLYFFLVHAFQSITLGYFLQWNIFIKIIMMYIYTLVCFFSLRRTWISSTQDRWQPFAAGTLGHSVRSMGLRSWRQESVTPAVRGTMVRICCRCHIQDQTCNYKTYKPCSMSVDVVVPYGKLLIFLFDPLRSYFCCNCTSK